MSIKERLSKVVDRAKVLAEKYPLVAGAVFGAGCLTGLLIAWVF